MPRKPDRKVVLSLRLDPPGIEALDRARGELTRSAWLREVVTQALTGKKPPQAVFLPPG
jgi:hypothetical protein